MELAPPCPSTNSTLLTMAFSSRITPHSVQTEAPEAPCSSMCVDPQLGQARPESAIDVICDVSYRLRVSFLPVIVSVGRFTAIYNNSGPEWVNEGTNHYSLVVQFKFYYTFDWPVFFNSRFNEKWRGEDFTNYIVLRIDFILGTIMDDDSSRRKTYYVYCTARKHIFYALKIQKFI